MGLCDFDLPGAKGSNPGSIDSNQQCSGKLEEPFEYDDHTVLKRKYLPFNKTGFHERPMGAAITNNGHKIVIDFEFYRIIPPTISSGPLPGVDTYVFQHLEFFWGDDEAAYEDEFHVRDGFPVQLHMIFANKKHDNLKQAQKYRDGVVVLAFYYQITENENPNYRELTKLLESITQDNASVPFQKPPLMDDLVSDDWDLYRWYRGSMTMPPCYVDVTWIDMEVMIRISAEQAESFRQLVTHERTRLIHNFGPPEPLKNRTIIVNEAAKIDLNGGSAIPFVDRLKDDGAASLRSATWVTILNGVVLLLTIANYGQ